MKRPFVLAFGIFLVLFSAASYLFREHVENRHRPLSLEAGESLPAKAEGILERIEKKPNSYYLYFRSVRITLNPSDHLHKEMSGSRTVFTQNRQTADNEHDFKKKQAFFYTEQVLVTTDSFPEQLYSPGNRLEIHGTISGFQRPVNPGMFDEEAYYKGKNIYYKIRASSLILISKNKWYFRNKILQLKDRIAKVYENALAPPDSGIINAMLLGEKSSLDMEIKDLYRANGISHLLAISGLHISLLCMAFCRMLFFFRISDRCSFFLTLFFLMCYGYMTGFPVSTSRAIIMMLLLLLSRQAGRSYDPPTAMAVSALFILLQSPDLLFSSGFLLSFSAVAGSVFVFPVINGIFYGTLYEQEAKKRRETRKRREFTFFGAEIYFFLKHLICSSFLCSLSVMLSTLPVLAFFYYEVPVYSVFLNAVLLPFAPVLVVCAALGGIIGLFSLLPAKIFLFPVHVILLLYQTCCKVIQKLPNAVYITGCPSLVRIFLYCLCLCILLLLFWKKIYEQEKFAAMEKAAFCCIICFSVFFLFQRPEIKGISYTLLDVGQGDGMILQTESGHTLLIDGGSSSVSEVGKYRILPFLKYNKIQTIDMMIMTHEDDDHILGQKEILENLKQNGISVNMYVLPEPSETSVGNNYKNMIHLVKKAGIPLCFLHAGDVISLGNARLFCLHPKKGFPAESANAYSTTLFLSYQSFSMLLTGDLEKNGEQALLETFRSFKYQNHLTGISVLKIAHHGSKNSTSEELLRLVSPKLCLISCGRKNHYGHPHKKLLERLEHIHSPVLRTDEGGAINITSNGSTWKSSCYYNK